MSKITLRVVTAAFVVFLVTTASAWGGVPKLLILEHFVDYWG